MNFLKLLELQRRYVFGMPPEETHTCRMRGQEEITYRSLLVPLDLLHMCFCHFMLPVCSLSRYMSFKVLDIYFAQAELSKGIF